jgi:hypothetical protein
MGLRRLLVVGAAAAAAAAAASGPASDPGSDSSPPAKARITGCGRVADTHYSFRVIAHGDRAPSCRRARRVARRAVGSQIDHPLRVPGWSCMADWFYDGGWSFLCIRRRTYGQVSVDRFRAVSVPGRAAGQPGSPPRSASIRSRSARRLSRRSCASRARRCSPGVSGSTAGTGAGRPSSSSATIVR